MSERDSESLTRRLGSAPQDPARWSNRTHHAAWGSRRSDSEQTAIRSEGDNSPWGDRGHPHRSSRSRVDASRRVPKMPKPQRETQVRSPGITVAGTVLIVGLTVLAFAGGRLFGRVPEPEIVAQPETPAQIVPAPELAVAAPELEPTAEAPMALPATFVR